MNGQHVPLGEHEIGEAKKREQLHLVICADNKHNK